MKDERGLYYYPNPANKQFRMYVRQEDDGTVCFRLWSQTDLKLWQDHGWVAWDAIQQASALYSGKQFSPQAAYDLDIAKRLLDDEDPN